MSQQNIAGTTGTVSGSGELVTYTVPGSVTVTPFSVAVVANGSGASGNFLPCLSFYSQAGNLIARAPAPEVASGDVALVSWFPHVAQASAPTPPPVSGGIQWAYISGKFTTTSVPGPGTTTLTSVPSTFYTNASSVFGTGTTDSQTGIVCKTVGHYQVWVSAGPFGTAADGSIYEIQFDGGGDLADWFGAKPVAHLPTGNISDEGIANVANIVTVPSGGAPASAMVAQIVNSGSNTLTMLYLGMYVIQLDTDGTVLS